MWRLILSNLPPPAPDTMPMPPSPRLPGHHRIAASALAVVDSQLPAKPAAPVSVLVYGVLLSETNTGCGDRSWPPSERVDLFSPSRYTLLSLSKVSPSAVLLPGPRTCPCY